MKEQNYLDHLVGVFGQPVAENPGVVIQDAAFKAMGLEVTISTFRNTVRNMNIK